MGVQRLTKSELDNIFSRESNNYGSEGIVLKDKDSLVVRKVFRSDFGMDENAVNIELVRDNKYKKLEILSKLDLLNEIKIINPVYCEDKFVAYDMISKERFHPYEFECLTPEEKIPYIEQTIPIIEDFHKNNIVYGDIEANNLVVNKNGEVAFCDLDNMQIDSYSIDVKNLAFFAFSDGNGLVDKRVDTYMHNLFTLSEVYYSLRPYFDILRLIDEEEFPKGMTENGKKVLKWMKKCFNSEKIEGEGDYLIQYVKR